MTHAFPQRQGRAYTREDFMHVRWSRINHFDDLRLVLPRGEPRRTEVAVIELDFYWLDKRWNEVGNSLSQSEHDYPHLVTSKEFDPSHCCSFV